MRNVTPVLLIVLAIVIGVLISDRYPAHMFAESKVRVEHVSSSKMSDGSLSVYCTLQNMDTVAVSDVEVSIVVTDSLNNVVQSRDLVFFSEGSLRPNQKALFVENFSDCWSCEGVQVSVE